MMDNFILSDNNSIDIIKDLLEKYNYYIVFFIMLLFIVTTYIIKNTYNYLSNLLVKRYNFNKNYIEN
ncbi:MAG: hypothetical protein Q8S84_02010 [bacterium]|nr:hypothetical protein [bacterium]MDP3380330.1 hypothetical protein [bacterium]